MKIIGNCSSDEINESDVGGKAKKLIELQSAGFPVKEFVVISVNSTNSILLKNAVSIEVLNEIFSLLNFGQCGVAVRSSAVGEDGNLSWAGQFDTKLFVDKKDLEKVIIECAQACNNESVRAYASTHGVEVPPLALVIQEMVDAETAGVLFTTTPVSNSSEAIIEAIAGVGDDLVSGLRRPIRFHFNLESGLLINVDGERNEIAFTNNQLMVIASFGRMAVDLFGSHQDIEWAIEKDTKKIFFNQSRVITSMSSFNLNEIREMAILESVSLLESEFSRLKGVGFFSKEDVLSDQNIVEILTPNPCQMAFGLFTYCFAHGDGAIKVGRNKMGYEIGSELDSGFFVLVGGQPRCSIIHDALTYRIQGIELGDYVKIIQFYLDKIRQDEKMANYPEIVLYRQNPEKEFLEGLFGEVLGDKYHVAYQEFFNNFANIENVLDEQCRNEFIPKWRKSMEYYASAHLSGDLQVMVSSYKNVSDQLRTEACVMFVQVARIGFFVYARLRNLLTEIFGERGEGFLNTVTSGIPVDLNPNLAFSVRLSQLRDGIVSVDNVLSEFGHLGIHELEVSIPRYREQPELIVELAQKISGSPGEELEASLERSKTMIDCILKDAGECRNKLEREIDIARRYLPLREVVKFEYLRGYDILRTIALALNANLGWDAGLIFCLDPTEIFSLDVLSANDLRQVAENRREKQNRYKALYVPAVMWSTGLDAMGKPSTLDSSILYGIGVTNYTVEGEVVVISDLNDRDSMSLLKPGSVLVTVTTDPAWTPFLSVIGAKGGLITEVGGLLAHAAIYAREVGLAAVLNVQNATSVLKTGMKVRVNGHQGYIEIIN